MFRPTENVYAQWRLQSGAASVLRDDSDSPPEQLLQAIWRHQRLQRNRLQTTDGRRVRVLHPGFTSLEGGPDFHDAVLQIGNEPPCSGDVEIDLRANGWHAHAHDRNPAFNHVLLHVVWDDAPARIQCPQQLSLRGALDATLGELGLWLENESPSVLPENCRGKCCDQLKRLNEAGVAELLNGAALVRFQAKAAQFHARARQVGWDQTLWEGLFRALGYKHNIWPMQNLAEARMRWAGTADSVSALQARLFGISGLLPADLSGASSKAGGYLRTIWDQWWRERDEFSDVVLPRRLWKFHGLRPANLPQRRLALVAHWLANSEFVSQLETWCAAGVEDSQLLGSLIRVLQIKCDEFWSWHWTFQSRRLSRPQPLLGPARATDLAINVILPWLWVRAMEGRNEKLQRVAEHRYFVWRGAQDNSLLRLARQRLFGTGKKTLLRRAAEQQGLTQIVRDFCENTNAVCARCRLPELLSGCSV